MLQTGDLLGARYEILQLLGEGGMGAVYKARDRELDRFVALKLIRPELAANASILARFKQELLLSREVTHRNVIRIYDLGDADGVKFITMEFVICRLTRVRVSTCVGKIADLLGTNKTSSKVSPSGIGPSNITPLFSPHHAKSDRLF